MTTRRVALVTGAAGGIGRAIALQLTREGYDVALADLHRDDLGPVVDDLGPSAPSALALELDVADAESRRAALAAVAERYGRLDVLVNCAGILKDSLIDRLPLPLLSTTLAVNLVGPLAMIAGAIPLLEVQGGAIVNIASRAWLGTFGSTAYSTSKGGLVGATRALALELGPSGITVNAVAPGYIETEMTAGLPDDVRAKTLASIAVNHVGQPADVAGAVAYLACAPYCTGQVLPVCGGRSIGEPQRDRSLVLA